MSFLLVLVRTAPAPQNAFGSLLLSFLPPSLEDEDVNVLEDEELLGLFPPSPSSGVGRVGRVGGLGRVSEVSEVSFYPSNTLTMNINAGNNEGNYKQGTARSLMSAVYNEE